MQRETVVRAGEELGVLDATGRRAKIVATLGPACADPATLRAMLAAGVDVARLNMSHGTQEAHAAVARAIRALAREMGRPLALLLDLQGPKIRTGPLKGGKPVALATGAPFTITTRPCLGDERAVSTTFAALPDDVRPGDRILLDDGAIELRVRATGAEHVACEVAHGGLLGEHKGINLPGVSVSAPALTSKDEADLRFGLDLAVDYVALSFVRSPDDAAPVKALIRGAGLATPVIAKLEKPEAIEHLGAIIAAFDGVMVARGDLGVELAPERVPMLQKQIIQRARRHGKVVITATQMLESMTLQPRPTRAEASDVANAVCDGTDALMLSGETAAGRYPVEAVAMMARIAAEAEAGRLPPEGGHGQPSHAHAVTRAACQMAEELRARAIVVFTRSGASAHLVAQSRPAVPVYAYTCEETTYRRLALWWGIAPVLLPFTGTTDAMLSTVTADLLARGAAREGDAVVFVGSTPMLVRGRTNFIKLQTISRHRGTESA